MRTQNTANPHPTRSSRVEEPSAALDPSHASGAVLAIGRLRHRAGSAGESPQLPTAGKLTPLGQGDAPIVVSGDELAAIEHDQLRGAQHAPDPMTDQMRWNGVVALPDNDSRVPVDPGVRTRPVSNDSVGSGRNKPCSNANCCPTWLGESRRQIARSLGAFLRLRRVGRRGFTPVYTGRANRLDWRVSPSSQCSCTRGTPARPISANAATCPDVPCKSASAILGSSHGDFMTAGYGYSTTSTSVGGTRRPVPYALRTASFLHHMRRTALDCSSLSSEKIRLASPTEAAARVRPRKSSKELIGSVSSPTACSLRATPTNRPPWVTDSLTASSPCTRGAPCGRGQSGQ